MKAIKTIRMVLLIAGTALLTAGCKKDGEGSGNDFKITDYMIVGETFWGIGKTGTPPYVIEFNSETEATVHHINDPAYTVNYEVSGNRVTILNSGHIDINKDLTTSHMLAGQNFHTMRLVKISELENKTYPKGDPVLWTPNGTTPDPDRRDYEITISGNKIMEKYQQRNASNVWTAVSNEHNFTKLTGAAGAFYQSQDKGFVFYVDPDDGRLVFWIWRHGGGYTHYKY